MGRWLTNSMCIKYLMMRCSIFKLSSEMKYRSIHSNPPNPYAWEISNCEKVRTMCCLDLCFEELDAFIDAMCYCFDNIPDLHWDVLIDAMLYWYDNIHYLHWVHRNKMKYPKCNKVDMKKQDNTWVKQLYYSMFRQNALCMQCKEGSCLQFHSPPNVTGWYPK